jgi:elongation factor 1-beta
MAFTLSFSLTDLKDLNTFLASRSYVVGFTASKTDAELFAALKSAPNAAKFPNVARYYSHIAALGDAKTKLPAVIGGSAVGAAAPAAAAKQPAGEDEDVDLFGEDGDAAAASVQAAKVRIFGVLRGPGRVHSAEQPAGQPHSFSQPPQTPSHFSAQGG